MPRRSAGSTSDEIRIRPKVLVLYPIDATFVRSDIKLLETFCDVETLRVDGRQEASRVLRAIGRADVVFSWFALGHAAFAAVAGKFLRAKTIVVAGGWDVARMPEIGYGRLVSRRGRLIAKIAFSCSDCVLAFSDWSAASIRSVSRRARVVRLYLGTDPSLFRPAAKENLVVCVAHVSRENLTRKGLITFVRAAARVPEARFALVGRIWDDAMASLQPIASPNLEFTGWLSDEKLREILGRARVYVQSSYTEGFGLAVVEAMASGCVPVVTQAGSLPEVVGDSGLYTVYDNPDDLATKIRIALASDLGSEARRRIMSRFALDYRLEGLRAVFDQLGAGVRDHVFPDSHVERDRLGGERP